MQTVTIDRTLYSFNELSEEAKERARDWWRQCENEDFDTSCMCEDFQRMGSLIGIELDTPASPLLPAYNRLVTVNAKLIASLDTELEHEPRY